jgi:sulfate adenylyltransferase subunit 2
MSTIENKKYDCLFGGARRDEEKARAKERFFSHRDEFGQWEPKNQRPELWSLYNGRKNPGEHFRVFPLSNWTELDVWEYIRTEEIEIPSLYFSHEREVFEREGTIYAHAPFMTLIEGETIEKKSVRFRTIGDVTCTGAVESIATTLDEVINEIKASRVTERGTRADDKRSEAAMRGTRADDKRSEAAMEDRKKQGYF